MQNIRYREAEPLRFQMPSAAKWRTSNRPPLPPGELENMYEYHRVLMHSLGLKNHLDVLHWLQGDMQRYLPHDIMIAAWGNFAMGNIHHDIISTIDGVRTDNVACAALTPLVVHCFAGWRHGNKKAFTISAGEHGFPLVNDDPDGAVRMALQTMRSAAVHGIKDARASNDCLYIAFSTLPASGPIPCATLTQVLPYIDNALRQVAHLPHQIDSACAAAGAIHSRYLLDHGLNQNEVDILGWIAMGKTNPEISSILEFSVFSIKNSIQRIFKKLNVRNRAQAVAALTNHA